MTTLDVRTLLFAVVLNNLVLGVTLRVGIPFHRGNGANKWVLALLMQSVGFAIWGLRESLPPVVSALTTASLISISLMLHLSALLDFYGKPVNPRLLWIAPAFITAFATLNAQNVPLRVAVASGTHALVMFVIARTAHQLRGPGPTLGNRIVVLGSALGGLIWLARSIAGATRPELYLATHEAGSVPAITTLIAQAITMMLSLGFLLMHRERLQHEIERLAMTDSLTGAFNRRTLYELGERELAATTPVSVVILDLDFFKKINDTHGHLAGDEVLKRFVAVTQSCLRATDILTRYGGEEFCVLLPGSSSELAHAIAERIRAAIERTEIKVEGRSIQVTSSAGVASRAAETPTTLKELLTRADEALYAAKRAGRNRVSAWAASSAELM